MIGTDIQIAAQLLKQGELVAIPTETVYGLAANAFDESAVLKIYKTKNRPQFNPLIIHSDSFQKFMTWGIHLPKLANKLAAQFSPGPITYVVPSSSKIPMLVTAGNNSVGIRIPDHSMTLELLRKLEFPLAAPSANPSGSISPTNANHVETLLGDKLKYILDGGTCRVGVESTIISFLEEQPCILRYGGICKESIENVLQFEINVGHSLNMNNDKILAPGMQSRHYAPKHRLIICDIAKELEKHEAKNCAVISFMKKYEEVPASQQFVLSSSGNLDEAASGLFSAMHKADKLDIECILTEKFPSQGLGYAINDKLKRASVPLENNTRI